MKDDIKSAKKSYPQNILNDIFDDFVSAATLPDLNRTLERVFDTLPQKWAECVKLRYQQNYTLEKIGQDMGFSRTRANQLLKKILLELKNPEIIKCIEMGWDKYQEYLTQEQYKKSVEKANRSLYEIPIEELKLSGRAYNALMRNGVTTIGKLSELDMEKLNSLKNMRGSAAEETYSKLNEFIQKRCSM